VRINCDDGSVHFDARVEEHIHFQCRCCGEISDIMLDEATENKALKLYNSFIKGFSGRIESGAFCFYGICDKCLEK